MRRGWFGGLGGGSYPVEAGFEDGIHRREGDRIDGKSALTGCFLAVNRDRPLEAAAEALVAFGVAGEDAARGAGGPGSFHVALYDSLAALDPATLDSRARVS